MNRNDFWAPPALHSDIVYRQYHHDDTLRYFAWRMAHANSWTASSIRFYFCCRLSFPPTVIRVLLLVAAWRRAGSDGCTSGSSADKSSSPGSGCPRRSSWLFPCLSLSMRAGFEGVERELEVRRTLGSGSKRESAAISVLTIRSLTRGLYSRLCAGSAVQATLMVAGNIPGKTQNHPPTAVCVSVGPGVRLQRALAVKSWLFSPSSCWCWRIGFQSLVRAARVNGQSANEFAGCFYLLIAGLSFRNVFRKQKGPSTIDFCILHSIFNVFFHPQRWVFCKWSGITNLGYDP